MLTDSAFTTSSGRLIHTDTTLSQYSIFLDHRLVTGPYSNHHVRLIQYFHMFTPYLAGQLKQNVRFYQYPNALMEN